MISEPSFLIALVAEVMHDCICVYWLGFEIRLDIFETVSELIILVDGVASIFIFSIFERLAAILIEIFGVPCCTCVMILITDLYWRNLANKVLGGEYSEDNVVMNFFAVAEQLEFWFCGEIIGAVCDLVSLLLNWYDSLDEIAFLELTG